MEQQYELLRTYTSGYWPKLTPSMIVTNSNGINQATTWYTAIELQRIQNMKVILFIESESLLGSLSLILLITNAVWTVQYSRIIFFSQRGLKPRVRSGSLTYLSLTLDANLPLGVDSGLFVKA